MASYHTGESFKNIFVYTGLTLFEYWAHLLVYWSPFSMQENRQVATDAVYRW